MRSANPSPALRQILGTLKGSCYGVIVESDPGHCPPRRVATGIELRNVPDVVVFEMAAGVLIDVRKQLRRMITMHDQEMPDCTCGINFQDVWESILRQVEADEDEAAAQAKEPY